MKLQDFGYSKEPWVEHDPPPCGLAAELEEYGVDSAQFQHAVLVNTLDSSKCRYWIFYFFRGEIDRSRRPDDVFSFGVPFDDPSHIFEGKRKFLGGCLWGANNAPPLDIANGWDARVVPEGIEALKKMQERILSGQPVFGLENSGKEERPRDWHVAVSFLDDLAKAAESISAEGNPATAEFALENLMKDTGTAKLLERQIGQLREQGIDASPIESMFLSNLGRMAVNISIDYDSIDRSSPIGEHCAERAEHWARQGANWLTQANAIEEIQLDNLMLGVAYSILKQEQDALSMYRKAELGPDPGHAMEASKHIARINSRLSRSTEQQQASGQGKAAKAGGCVIVLALLVITAVAPITVLLVR